MQGEDKRIYGVFVALLPEPGYAQIKMRVGKLRQTLGGGAEMLFRTHEVSGPQPFKSNAQGVFGRKSAGRIGRCRSFHNGRGRVIRFLPTRDSRPGTPEQASQQTHSIARRIRMLVGTTATDDPIHQKASACDLARAGPLPCMKHCLPLRKPRSRILAILVFREVRAALGEMYQAGVFTRRVIADQVVPGAR